MDLFPELATGPGLTVDGRSLDGASLLGAAGAVAVRVEGMPTVAVRATSTLETIVGVVGALLAGVPVVPLPPDAGSLERDHILSDCAAAEILGETLPVDVAERRDYSCAPGRSDRVAMIVYTSGTTGLPKGVMLSAASIATDLDLLAEAWEWTGDDVLVHGLPLFHVHGLILGVLGALRTGSRLVHTGRPTPAAYAAAGGSLYFGVPTVWSRVASDPAAAAGLRGARVLVSGSAGLPVPVFERLAAATGLAPIERYGMTETLITVSGRAAAPRRAGWAGWPLRGVETRLVDEEGAEVAADGETVGELEVRGPTSMAGYLNRPEETAALYREPGWVRTGDVAMIDGEGWHCIVGRRSVDLIKTGGFRIGAGEVEAALLAHPGVSEAAVVGVPDEDLGQVVVGYVVAAGVSGDELCDFVARTLSVHKRPRRVELVDELPRNAMGKVQKGLLLDR